MRNTRPERNPLRRIREARGMSAAELAKRAGTTQSQITRLENDGMPGATGQNSRKITKPWAQKLAPHLACTWQELLEAGEIMTERERNMLMHYRMASPEQQVLHEQFILLMLVDSQALNKMFAFASRQVAKLREVVDATPEARIDHGAPAPASRRRTDEDESALLTDS